MYFRIQRAASLFPRGHLLAHVLTFACLCSTLSQYARPRELEREKTAGVESWVCLVSALYHEAPCRLFRAVGKYCTINTIFNYKRFNILSHTQQLMEVD
jgi:hypothetical protein